MSRVPQEDTSDGNTAVVVSYLFMNLTIDSILFFYYLYFNTNSTKQSTGIEILEKAGHRNPEVVKYEGFTQCYSWFALSDSIFFFTITIYKCVI